MRLGVLGSDTPRAKEAIETQLAQLNDTEESLVILGTEGSSALAWAEANGVGHETRAAPRVARLADRLLVVIDSDDDQAEALRQRAAGSNVPTALVELEPAETTEGRRSRRERPE
jgi:hypothetical protein